MKSSRMNVIPKVVSVKKKGRQRQWTDRKTSFSFKRRVCRARQNRKVTVNLNRAGIFFSLIYTESLKREQSFFAALLIVHCTLVFSSTSIVLFICKEFPNGTCFILAHTNNTCVSLSLRISVPYIYRGISVVRLPLLMLLFSSLVKVSQQNETKKKIMRQKGRKKQKCECKRTQNCDRKWKQQQQKQNARIYFSFGPLFA